MSLKIFISFTILILVEVNTFSLAHTRRSSGEYFNDKNCDIQLQLFSDAFTKREMWALRLFDTWSKMHSGYLAGNTINYGHFTECVRFRHNEIQGQHCKITFSPLSNSTITADGQTYFNWREIGEIARQGKLNSIIHSVCLPATCNAKKVLEFVNTFLIRADLIAQKAGCLTNDSIALEMIDIIAIVIFSVFVLLLIASTSYDIIVRQKSEDPDKLYTAFSVYTNGKILFDMTRSTSPSSIDCLHGLRALSVLYIIFDHRYYQLASSVANPNEVAELYKKIYSVVYTSSPLAVETFFVMAALLVTRSTLIALDRKQLNIPRMILHRYLRYTPLFAALILYTVSIAKFAYTGPGEYNSGNCEQFWWSSLLHIQNYVNVDKLCIGHSWYLSVDFQLFVISPFLIYPAWKYGNKYVWTFGVLALMVSVYILTMSLSTTIHLTRHVGDRRELFHKWVYYPTHARMAPWFVGMILGYILYKNGNKKVEMSKVTNAALWITVFSLLMTVYMTGLPLNVRVDNQTSLLFNAFTIAFYRLAWAIAIAIIIYCCHVVKTGGCIRWFLSLNEWQPIGRMGLSIYLVHAIYQGTLKANEKQLIFGEIWPQMHAFWGDIFPSIFLGSLLYLTFEAPFLLIEDYFYKKRHSVQKSV